MIRCDLEEREKTVTDPGKTDLPFIRGEKIEKRLEMEADLERAMQSTRDQLDRADVK